MIESPLIEIRVPGRPVWRLRVDRAIEVGRAADVIVIDDGVSRRHLKLLPSPLGLSVVDLGSSNGTLVNGSAITARTLLEPGDVVRLGHTDIVLTRVGAVPTVRPPTAGGHLLPLPAPPPARVVTAGPSPAGQALRWLLRGGEPPVSLPTFRSYLEFPRHLPQAVWQGVRVASVLVYLSICIGMFVSPAGALFAFFKVIVPLLPILFFLAPGLWRNICPLAAANQAARVFGFGLARTAPAWMAKRGYLIAISLFLGLAGARLALFNAHGAATGILLILTIASAFAMGATYKGKSGWCSSICPLLPLQRLYGQTPFVKVANTHCNPCVACTKNCYDFKPQPAYQTDLADTDLQWVNPRRLFAAALPGFVLGFFTVANNPGSSLGPLYERLALYVAVSVAVFFVLDAVLPMPRSMVTALFGATAISIFYWFGADVLVGSIQQISGIDAAGVRWPIRVLVPALCAIWISRTYWVQRRFDEQSVPTVGGPVALTLAPPRRSKNSGSIEMPTEAGASVRFLPADTPVPASTGDSLLELIERAGLPIEAGCRMGVCGADPVAVTGGASCLSAIGEEERNTLRRIGFADNTRMACCARIDTGQVEVSLTPQPGTPGVDRPVDFDASITAVVVIGGGIAGLTAADFVRRGHPDCEIHVIGAEPHGLYNRMGISRLVYGRSAMTGLHLLEEQWYLDHAITTWLNTVARWIDPVNRRVGLATGEILPYDRLILATGSSGTAPDIPGFAGPGSFVLRAAADAMGLRAYAQQQHAREAVVAGGGLLGLEAACALNELGLRVTVLERGARLMTKQVDERCSVLIHEHFHRLGIEIEYRAESAELRRTDGRVQAVVLRDGRTVPSDIFLAAVGISPNIELARAAGLSVRRGVLVDDRMQTSTPGIFAAGDVAEHGAQVLGLWPIAAKQGEVAAVNALGGDSRLAAEVPATILKGVGLELSSIGRVAAAPGDEVIVTEEAGRASYRRLLVARGVVVGALVLGHHPEDLAAATAAVKNAERLDQWAIAELRTGNWAVLRQADRLMAGMVG